MSSRTACRPSLPSPHHHRTDRHDHRRDMLGMGIRQVSRDLLREEQEGRGEEKNRAPYQSQPELMRPAQHHDEDEDKEGGAADGHEDGLLVPAVVGQVKKISFDHKQPNNSHGREQAQDLACLQRRVVVGRQAEQVRQEHEEGEDAAHRQTQGNHNIHQLLVAQQLSKRHSRLAR
eukprot:110510-Hanusia_phi.AAC.1